MPNNTQTPSLAQRLESLARARRSADPDAKWSFLTAAVAGTPLAETFECALMREADAGRPHDYDRHADWLEDELLYG